MKFVAGKEELLNGIRIVERATVVKGLQPVLANILFETLDSNQIKFRGNGTQEPARREDSRKFRRSSFNAAGIPRFARQSSPACCFLPRFETPARGIVHRTGRSELYNNRDACRIERFHYGFPLPRRNRRRSVEELRFAPPARRRKHYAVQGTRRKRLQRDYFVRQKRRQLLRRMRRCVSRLAKQRQRQPADGSCTFRGGCPGALSRRRALSC